MDLSKILITAVTCLFLLFGSVSAVILINEVELNPPAGGGEWIELYNTDGDFADISGYIITDNTGTGVVLPAGSYIDSNGFFVITDEDFGFGLNNENEILTLNDSAGNISDITPRPKLKDNDGDSKTWQRIPNGYDTDSENDWQFCEETYDGLNSCTGGIPEFPTFILPVLIVFASLSFARNRLLVA